ncbi:PREDICTED: T-cell surface antigen CD2, partial [Nanorana parkeri]|uniref:T-cell surface antigen CD2 n=1 Tax=Nanorana parkeri TaxID=125878 RepID=UPI0008542FFF
AAGTASISYTFAVNGSAQLDVPSCSASATDQVEWKSGNVRLVKGKPADASKSKLDTKCNCKIMPNGALHLQRLVREGDYKVEVHNEKGELRCSGTVSAKTQYPVDQPFMNHTCKGKKQAEVGCFISRGSDLELHLKQDNKKTVPLKGKSLIIFGWSNQSTNVTCTASNLVSQTSISIIINCEGDVVDWYIYLAAAAGGVAFIIFIALIVYSVRTCRRPKRERAEETMYCNDRRQVIQERQLPQPPVQASAPPPSYYTTDETEDVSSERPPTQRLEAPEAAPTGKKARRPRPPEPPNGQPESVLLNPQGPAPQQTKPALPGNHPKDQAPKPTPRTKSKPTRQNRKRH